MEEKTFEPKIRIQLLNQDGSIASDRLVNQKIEFATGPKNSWKGPMKFEITLKDQSDITDFNSYIEKLQSDLPVREINSKGRPSTSSNNELESPRENILLEVEKIASEGSSQKDIIKYLRSLGFVFILAEDFLRYFPEFEFEGKDIGEPNSNGQYPESLAWMVRCIKKAKSPLADKYDCMILFGFPLFSKKESIKIIPYLYRERKKYVKVKVKTGNKNAFKTYKELTKFPAYMIEEERLKFQVEMRILADNKEKTPSKFFVRWAPDVILSTEMDNRLSHIELPFKNRKN